MKRTAYSILLSASMLSALAGCHGTAPEPAPPVELAAVKPGSVNIQRDQDGTLRIPATALVQHVGTPGVFIEQQGKARFRMVKAGKQSADMIEINSGLDGDEVLFTGPFDNVYDGSPVTYQSGEQRNRK